jgi:DNA ligase-like protein
MNEKHNRIRVALFAYAYEIENISLIADSEFDELCGKIQPNEGTGNEEMDRFFRTEFNSSTGMWIHKHPQIAGIQRIFESITSKSL